MTTSLDIIKDVISIGPAVVDMTFHVSDVKYDELAIYLQTKPGGWVSIRTLDELHQLFTYATGLPFPGTINKIIELQKSGIIKMSAGSTNLGVLSALTLRQRRRSGIITTVGCDIQGNIDTIAQIFTDQLQRLNIHHVVVPVLGHNPLGMVFTAPNRPDRILANFSGIAPYLSSLAKFTAKFLHVDAYELRIGVTASTLDDLIRSKSYQVALGLGNRAILTGHLLNRIRDYCLSGLISVLVGNEQEIMALCSITTPELDPVQIMNFELLRRIPYVLITLGEKGLCSIIDRQVTYVPAYVSQKTVSTSGAGDVAAGVFISGILDGLPIDEILRSAAYYAAVVLGYPENFLLYGRP